MGWMKCEGFEHSKKKQGKEMIKLGTYDAGVTQDMLTLYKDRVKDLTRVSTEEVKEGSDKLRFHSHAPDVRQPMSVAQVQQALKSAGFFPGGAVDGICGYRTLSAIRLFQEYVRSIEKLSSVPDGLFGPNAQGHLQRWIDQGKVPDWATTVAQWREGTLADTEYNRWLTLGEKVKARYMAEPNRMLNLVNAFAGATDTKQVADWEFDPKHMHLIGVRRDEFSGKFDDIFIFLIKGLVFKFQGSTEPGSSEHERGRPFLVQGQHDYHFGWHQRRYLALRPRHLDSGVLVVRSKNNHRLDDSDLDSGLEANATINIHWGGKGITFNVSTWSAGCQVINGTLYINHQNDLMDCSSFVARNNGAVGGSKTRGAYNVMVDLATALSSDMESNTVKYLLLKEQDLELDPVLKQGLSDARGQAGSALE